MTALASCALKNEWNGPLPTAKKPVRTKPTKAQVNFLKPRPFTDQVVKNFGSKLPAYAELTSA